MYTKARAEGKFDHLRPLKVEREKFRCFPDGGEEEEEEGVLVL